MIAAERNDNGEMGVGVDTHGSFKKMHTLEDRRETPTSQEAALHFSVAEQHVADEAVKDVARPQPSNPTEKQNVSAHDRETIKQLQQRVGELEENLALRRKLAQDEEELRNLKEHPTPALAPKIHEVSKKQVQQAPPVKVPPKPVVVEQDDDKPYNPFGKPEDSLLEKRLEVVKNSHATISAEDPKLPTIDWNERLRQNLLSKGWLTPGKETAPEVEAFLAEERKQTHKQAKEAQYQNGVIAPNIMLRAPPKERPVNQAYVNLMKKVQQEDLLHQAALLQRESVEVHRQHPRAEDDLSPFGEPEEDEPAPQTRKIDRVALAKNLAAQRQDLHDKTIRQVEEHLAKQQKEEEERIVKDIEERSIQEAKHQREAKASIIEDIEARANQLAKQDDNHPMEEGRRHAEEPTVQAKHQRETKASIIKDIEARANQLVEEDANHPTEEGIRHAEEPMVQEHGVAEQGVHQEDTSVDKVEAQAYKEKSSNVATNTAPAEASLKAAHDQKTSPSTSSSKDIRLATQKVREKDDDDGPSIMDDIPSSAWEFSRPGSEKISRADRVALSMFADKDPTHARLPPDGATSRTQKASEHELEQQPVQQSTPEQQKESEASEPELERQPEQQNSLDQQKQTEASEPELERQPEQQNGLDRQKQTEAKLSAQQAEIERLQAQVAAMQAKSTREGQDDSENNQAPEHSLESDVVMQAS